MPYSPPSSQLAPLATIVLKVKLLDMGDPRSLLSTALSPPNIGDIVRTVLQLKEVNKYRLRILPFESPQCRVRNVWYVWFYLGWQLTTQICRCVLHKEFSNGRSAPASVCISLLSKGNQGKCCHLRLCVYGRERISVGRL